MEGGDFFPVLGFGFPVGFPLVALGVASGLFFADLDGALNRSACMAFLLGFTSSSSSTSSLTSLRSFTGAAKRLEVLAKNDSTIVYRDFAHAPSKVKATIDAVKNQFPNRKFIAALELHTYSSLNEAFMKELIATYGGKKTLKARKVTTDLSASTK